MVYVNQLKLVEKGFKKNKSFLKAVYSCTDFLEAKKWFDKLDCRIFMARQDDNEMTLEKFLKGINKNSDIALQFGSPHPFKIRYCANFCDSTRVDRFAWVICPYNEHNFGLIAKLYKKSFGIKLENEPVPKGLLEYYNERVKRGF